VEDQVPIENGVRLRVRPTTEAARASLGRVLDAHPHMLRQETGWSMAVEETDGAYVLRTTTDDPADTAKIRALGYMGLLAYGQHHQRHHWHLVKGKHPHSHGSK
jgi:carbohydrate-selective porin OprB